jgi:hypothetical protein
MTVKGPLAPGVGGRVSDLDRASGIEASPFPLETHVRGAELLSDSVREEQWRDWRGQPLDKVLCPPPGFRFSQQRKQDGGQLHCHPLCLFAFRHQKVCSEAECSPPQ